MDPFKRICNVLEDFNFSTCDFLNSANSPNLLNCWSLTTLLEGLGYLTSFMKLNMLACSRLTTLHEGFGKLTPLTTLDL